MDLIRELPAGSHLLASHDRRAEWGRDTSLLADIADALLTISWQIGHVEGADEPVRIVRPGMEQARRAARDRSKRVQDIIRNTEWEAL